MRRAAHRTAQQGFTLVEAVVAITLIGIIGGMVTLLIVKPVQGYRDAVARAELTDIADLALRRMARDLRLALPNSIRVSGTTIEFLQTKTGGRYLAVEDESGVGRPLDFVTASNTKFTLVTALPSGKQAIVPGSDYLVVNNLGIDQMDAYRFNNAATRRNIARISALSVESGLNQIELASNPFALQDPPMPSPTARFQVVSGPVTYHCVPGAGGSGTLTRQWNYDIQETQPVPPVAARTSSSTGAQSNYIATHVKSCSFDYQTVASTRTALVRLTLVLFTDETGDVTLEHQVHVDNTP